VVVQNLDLVRCTHCAQDSFWYRERMLYPPAGAAPMPNPDLPDEVRADYEEAREIVSRSPRGAAALLRLAIQKLCDHLGEQGKNLNVAIASLAEQGLSPKIQKALDVVRVIGNNAVHPGMIDLRDDVETAGQLFGLVNIIAEVMITQARHVDAMYERLPAEQREAIERRDERD
jgi:hypothetical protein